MIQDKIKNLIKDALKNLGIDAENISLEHPGDLLMGDYSTNVAMALAKSTKQKPKELAEKIVFELEKNKVSEIEKIEAKNGFINFYLSRDFFKDSIGGVLGRGEDLKNTEIFAGKKFFIEHTQPNPFKEFHIGHLMNNTIGESIVRLVSSGGAEVKSATYHGDKGLHVAKAIWYLLDHPGDFLTAYAQGHKAYEEDEQAKKEITEINKKIYSGEDVKINELFEQGRAKSFELFEKMYAKLGSHFDYHFLESEAGEKGKKLVLDNIGKVFEESEGAVVFKGEKYGLHTRVFLNSEKLPTYEAKEVGLAEMKKNLFPYDQSITITANEQDAFFDVTEVAIGEVFPELKGKLKHISHGMLRLPSGKMSSRTGTIISAESLLSQIKEKVLEKIGDRDLSAEQKEKISEQVSMSALKYSILKQATGGDIIYDFEKSISFEGDSGPYLQYTFTRANSVLNKADIAPDTKNAPDQVFEVEKILYRFSEIVARSQKEYQPHYIANYLIDLARSFNSFYGNNQILDKEDEFSPYKLAITSAVAIVLKNGLYLLGIEAPEKM